MIKSLLTYCIGFALLFFAVLHIQDWLLKLNEVSVRFSFYDTSLFFAVASALICTHLKIFSGIKNLQSQLGFIYLPTLIIKGIFFYILFRKSVFYLEKLNTTERLSLLFPLFIFLALEVYFIIKILKQNEAEI